QMCGDNLGVDAAQMSTAVVSVVRNSLLKPDFVNQVKKTFRAEVESDLETLNDVIREIKKDRMINSPKAISLAKTFSRTNQVKDLEFSSKVEGEKVITSVDIEKSKQKLPNLSEAEFNHLVKIANTFIKSNEDLPDVFSESIGDLQIKYSRDE